MAIDDTMKALADPTRRQILRLLRRGDRTAGEIAAAFPISAPSVSHHLSVLKDAGLVQATREGRSIVYSLDTTVFQDVMKEIMGLFDVGGSR